MKRSEINRLLAQAVEFLKECRFSTIEEDEQPLYCLCNEYPPAG